MKTDKLISFILFVARAVCVVLKLKQTNNNKKG